MLTKICATWDRLTTHWRQNKSALCHAPTLRLIGLEETSENEYIAKIQVINKNLVLKMKPTTLLANDHLLSQFSSCDVRTLTYLGYLDMHSPRYKIIRKKPAYAQNKLFFTLQVRGQAEVMIKTAAEIFEDEEMLKQLYPGDANLVGYTMASESMQSKKVF